MSDLVLSVLHELFLQQKQPSEVCTITGVGKLLLFIFFKGPDRNILGLVGHVRSQSMSQ